MPSGYDWLMRTTPTPSMKLSRADAVGRNVHVLSLLRLEDVTRNLVPVPEVTKDED